MPGTALMCHFAVRTGEIIRVTPEKSTGIDEVLVAYNSSALTEMIISDGGYTKFSVERYSNLGGRIRRAGDSTL